MINFLIGKICSFIFTLFAIATITFFLMKSVPGDPFSDEQALKSNMQLSLMQQYGLDQPFLIQYYDYLINLLHGKLGYSYKFPDRSVNTIIREGFPISAWLGLQAFCIALIFGIVLGILSALKFNQWQDKGLIILTTAGVALPSFILATLLQYCFAIYFPIFPLARWGTITQTILPSLALAASPMTFICRLTRMSLLETFRADYIKLARSKGLQQSFWMWRHALPNAFLPVLSYIGPLLANVLIGSFVIEKIFSIPGLGQWFVNSVSNRDYSLIMGLTLFYSFLLLSAVFLVDCLYGILDPRIKNNKIYGE